MSTGPSATGEHVSTVPSATVEHVSTVLTTVTVEHVSTVPTTVTVKHMSTAPHCHCGLKNRRPFLPKRRIHTGHKGIIVKVDFIR